MNLMATRFEYQVSEDTENHESRLPDCKSIERYVIISNTRCVLFIFKIKIVTLESRLFVFFKKIILENENIKLKSKQRETLGFASMRENYIFQIEKIKFQETSAKKIYPNTTVVRLNLLD